MTVKIDNFNIFMTAYSQRKSICISQRVVYLDGISVEAHLTSSACMESYNENLLED